MGSASQSTGAAKAAASAKAASMGRPGDYNAPNVGHKRAAEYGDDCHATNFHAPNTSSRTPARVPSRAARGISLSTTSSAVSAAIQETLITPVAKGISMRSPQQAIEATLACRPPPSPPVLAAVNDPARQR